MTASYLILTPPDGPDRNHDTTRCIRDGFSWLAFIFPVLWLLGHRLWLAALTAFLLQGLGGRLLEANGGWPAGIAVLFGISILTALEGRNLHISNLVSKGWTLEAVVSADSIDAAEEIYFSSIETSVKENEMPRPQWDRDPGKGSSGGGFTAMGLFGFDGGR
ncbi:MULTISPECIES: DUF2628 domain-containing protein [unclassified Sinorhizobium]|uniref:DUF2628 domain-containing protein n=1 Tax=unclassified Sinorhizobium TaxID=2613772 RepID=UPI00352343EB